MTKTLTQADFKGAPDWVRSAAVDNDGYAWGFDVLKNGIYPCKATGIWKVIDPNYNKTMALGKGYDTTNWRESAIDREEPARPREYIKDTI